MLIASYLPLRVEENKPKTIQCALPLLSSAHHGAAANVAYAFGNSNGNVPDDWVFDCQGSIGSSRIKRPLTLFAVE